MNDKGMIVMRHYTKAGLVLGVAVYAASWWLAVARHDYRTAIVVAIVAGAIWFSALDEGWEPLVYDECTGYLDDRGYLAHDGLTCPVHEA